MSVRRLISVVLSFCCLAGAGIDLSAESFQIAFRVGKYAPDSTYSYNSRAFSRLSDALNNASASRITITSYASPDGSFSRNRRLSSLRADSVRDLILSTCPSIDTSNMYIVSKNEDWDGVRQYLNHSSKEWKQEALDILNSKSSDIKARLQDLWVGEAWEDLLKNCFPALRRVSVSLEYSTPAVQELWEEPVIVFNQGSSVIPGTCISALKQLAATPINTLYIYIKASPEGTMEGNKALSLKRASRIESLLRRFGYGGVVSVQYRGEDWDGLLQVVQDATDLPDKEAIIDILQDSGLDRDARKKALQTLSYGHTWLRLMDTEMKGLRRASVSTNLILK